MRSSRRSPVQVLREIKMTPAERGAARSERETEDQMRRERDSTREAERLAAHAAAEARRHSNQNWFSNP